jgi:hypothetical protein
VLTLTVKEADPAAAIGRVYKFWAKVRQRWLGTRYFCWLELQRRGAVHYHCVWLNPPPVWRANLVAWVDHAWGGGRTQVRFPQAREGLRHELDYALKYADKMKHKAYQQRYDEVPRELRTFMSQRLEIPGKKLDEHRDTDLWDYDSGQQSYDPDLPLGWRYRGPSIRYVGTRTHVLPPGARCSALDHRRLPHSRAGTAAVNK